MAMSPDPPQSARVWLRQTKCGLEMSLLERLMERQPYKRDPGKFADHGNYDPLVVGGASGREMWSSTTTIFIIETSNFRHGNVIIINEQGA